MDLEYLSGLWQQDDGGTRFSVPAENLHESLRRSANKFERRIRWRDWRELVALILGGVLFLFTAFVMLPEKLDTHWVEHWDWILLGLSCWALGAVFVRERRRARQYVPQLDDDILTTLERQCNSLRHQIGLMERVGTWYILPFVVPWTIVVIRSFPPSWRWPYFVAGLLIFGLIIVWNHWYAKHRVQPRLDANEQLLKEAS